MTNLNKGNWTGNITSVHSQLQTLRPHDANRSGHSCAPSFLFRPKGNFHLSLSLSSIPMFTFAFQVPSLSYLLLPSMPIIFRPFPSVSLFPSVFSSLHVPFSFHCTLSLLAFYLCRSVSLSTFLLFHSLCLSCQSCSFIRNSKRDLLTFVFNEIINTDIPPRRRVLPLRHLHTSRVKTKSDPSVIRRRERTLENAPGSQQG